MAGEHLFTLNATPEVAYEETRKVLEAQGFNIEPQANNVLHAQRGSLPLTIALGVFAGKAFHVSLYAQVIVESDQTRVKMFRDAAKGYLKGGVVGANKTDKLFKEVANAMFTHFSNNKLLIESKIV